MLPEYMETAVQTKLSEIINGFDIVKSIVPDCSIAQYLDQLKLDYIQVIGHTNGLRSSDIEDHHRILIIATKRAIKHFEALV